MTLVKALATKKLFVLNDFNIDYSRKFVVTYSNKQLFADFKNVLSHLVCSSYLLRWSKLVNSANKKSILNLIYSNTFVVDINSVCPIF